MFRVLHRLILSVNSKHKNREEVCEKGGNKVLGKGQPIKRKGINLGNIWEDCSPSSTQPMMN